MPHPYTETELDNATWTKHTGSCGDCWPVDPENMTQEEYSIRGRCAYCVGTGITQYQLLDVSGTIGLCQDCGGDTSKITRHLRGSGIRPGPLDAVLICRNCLIQEHYNYCRENNGSGSCPHGWLTGSA